MLSIKSSQYSYVKHANTSLKIWEKLKNVYESHMSPMKQCAIFRQLYRMKKSANQSMSEYVNEFSQKLEQLEKTGIKLPKNLLPVMLLNSLPSEYETFCIAIESREKLATLNELKIKLAEEEVRRNEDPNSEGALLTKRKKFQDKRSIREGDAKKMNGSKTT